MQVPSGFCVDCDRPIRPDGSKPVAVIDEEGNAWHFSCFEKAHPADAFIKTLRLAHATYGNGARPWQDHHGSQGGQGRSGKDVSGAGLALAICVVLFLVLVGLAALGVG